MGARRAAPPPSEEKGGAVAREGGTPDLCVRTLDPVLSPGDRPVPVSPGTAPALLRRVGAALPPGGHGAVDGLRPPPGNHGPPLFLGSPGRFARIARRDVPAGLAGRRRPSRRRPWRRQRFSRAASSPPRSPALFWSPPPSSSTSRPAFSRSAPRPPRGCTSTWLRSRTPG